MRHCAGVSVHLRARARERERMRKRERERERDSRMMGCVYGERMVGSLNAEGSENETCIGN